MPKQNKKAVNTVKPTLTSYTFIDWNLTQEMWNCLRWYDKLRAIIYFKIILPKSTLRVNGKKI